MSAVDLDTYGPLEYEIFRGLRFREKIEFLYNVLYEGVDNAVAAQLRASGDMEVHEVENFHEHTFQFPEGELYVAIFDAHVHIYSDSLKAMKRFVMKLYLEGNIMQRQDTAKDPYDEYRYYRHYVNISKGNPLSLN